jgi:PAS domain S-box-containing protein
MSKFNPRWWAKPPVILSYGVAVLSVIAVLIIAWWIERVWLWQSVPHVSLFLCAVMFSAWSGGTRPGLLALVLSVLAFNYYFLPPIYSFALTKELPRLVFFALSGLFVVWLTAAQRSAAESLRDARDDLYRTVGELKRINEALQAENAERQRAEDALRRNEAYLAEAQKLSHTGSFGWNVSTGEIFWSEETHRIAGYDLGIKPTVELILQRIHPEDIARVQETLDRASHGGTALDFEHRFLMPDGTVKYVHVLAHAVRDQSGNIEYVGAAMDITAARRAEDELRKNEEKYRDLVDLSPDAIYLVDKQSNFVSANPAGLELLRCTAEDAAGMPVVETYLPEERAVFQGRVEQLQAGACLRFERIFVRKDGTQVPVEVSTTSMRHGYSQVVVRDISERKRAETKLRRSEAYLAGAQKLSRTGSWAGTPDLLKSTYWSAEMFRIMGFPRGDNPPTNEEVSKHFAPEAWAGILELFESARRGKIDCDGEFPLVLPDGSNRVIRIVGHPVLNAAGDIVEFVGTTIDVTEQRQARAALEKALAEIKKSQDRLRVIIDTIPALAWSSLPDGSAEFLNQRLLDYTGLSAQRAQGWGWTVAIHPEDSKKLLETWRTILASGRPGESEARMRRFDGEYRWFLFRAIPLRDELGNIVRWYGTNTDIEDRKQAEEIRTAQTRQAGLRADVSAALSKPADSGEILRGCAEAIVRHLEAAFARIWTLNKEKNMLELQASAGMYTHLDGPHSRIQVGKLKIGLIAEEKRPHLTNDVVNDPRVSDKNWAQNEGMVSFAGYPLIVQDRVVGVMAMFARQRLSAATLDTLASVADTIAQGIERKRAEEALREAQAELAHVTRVMTMGELAGSIAHEINQPLAAVITNGSACLRWLAAREAVGRIIRDGNRASDVIGRIRALVKKSGTEQVRLDINEVIQEVVGLIQNEIPKNGVVLRMKLTPDLPRVLGDRVQLQQVILNLVMNGIEAMSAVTDRSRDLLLRSHQYKSDKVLIAVQDSGIGLQPESLDHLFEAFFTTKPQGMGMGLAISRSIVENHGGRLWATVNEDRGATFQFTLPTADAVSIDADATART